MGRASTEQRPAVIGDRYVVEDVLGEGGTAVVYRVRDGAEGEAVALKQLLPGAKSHATLSQLFEQEFYTLSQLSHPRIVEVYDYVRDPSGAFYTMELLDGGDLRELSPLPWRRTCALLRDVCSALSLLHSRRLVHRDLTPRNVRCTRDGKAKLMDFGGMGRVGPSKQIVGTASFIAPEALSAQIIDPRTDLFSLGATAYYALTGRYAYPARTFSDVRDAWRTRPAPPSTLNPGVPPEVDRLVLDLLELAPLARPASAAEVIERLSALADLPADEQLEVRSAYLATPNLVGRDDAVQKVRKQVFSVVGGRGMSLLISGEAGVGRSRFLDACILEAKLGGATVLRTDPADSAAGNWGAAQSLARQLLAAFPQAEAHAAEHRAVLAHILPELRDGPDGASPQPFDSPQELRAGVMRALRVWFAQNVDDGCLMLAVDDLHRLDEPSASLLALLATATRRRRLGIIATVESNRGATAPEAVDLFVQSSAAVKLRPLDLTDTEGLFRSMFGDVPNVRVVTSRLHKVSGGKPRELMELTQHLLDTGVVRYEAGAWSLPRELDPAELPTSLGDALRRRVERLNHSALELAQILALADRPGLLFAECVDLSAHDDAGAVVGDLNALVAADIVTTDGSWYSLTHPSWSSVLTSHLDEERARTLHARIAKDLASAPPNQRFRHAHHLLCAGDRLGALDAMLEYARGAAERRTQGLETYFEFINMLPTDWLPTYESIIQICRDAGRSRSDLTVLQQGLISFASVTARMPHVHLTEVTELLARESGLSHHATLDESLEPGARVGLALGAARERYDATDEAERVYTPVEAIQQLAQTTIRAIGIAGRALDYDLLESMPAMTPFAALSPAVEMIDLNRQSTLNVLGGSTEQAREGYLRIIERMGEPDGAGIQGSDHNNMRAAVMWAVGTIEIQGGLKSSTKWADAIEESPLFEVNAWRLRLVNAIRQADVEAAENCRTRLELLRLQNRPTQLFEGSYLSTLAMAYASCQDLIHIKELLPDLHRMASEMPNWVPCREYAEGAYQVFRGDHERALGHFERGLAIAKPGRHFMWAPLSGLLLASLHQLGRLPEARERGDRMLAAGEAAQVETISTYVRQPLALVEAGLGNFSTAIAYADADVERLTALGATGVVLGSIYETRARVAIAMDEAETFQKYAGLCAAEYRVGQNPPLTAKFERLLRDARERAMVYRSEDLPSGIVPAERQEDLSNIATMLTGCQGPRERARRALRLLLSHTGLEAGFLYTLQADGPHLAAEHGFQAPPPGMDTAVVDYLQKAAHESEEATKTATSVDTQIDTSFGADAPPGFTPLLIWHDTGRGFAITGVAVVQSGESSGAWKPPYDLLSTLSQSLLDSGDVATLMVSA